jgi:hypothetical protein
MSSANDTDWIDGRYFPEEPVPERIESLWGKVDYVVRVCSAWDFGLPPRAEVFRELLRPSWKEAVAEAKLLTSCAYHLLLEQHGLPPVPYLGPRFPEILADPCLDRV